MESLNPCENTGVDNKNSKIMLIIRFIYYKYKAKFSIIQIVKYL